MPRNYLRRSDMGLIDFDLYPFVLGCIFSEGSMNFSCAIGQDCRVFQQKGDDTNNGHGDCRLLEAHFFEEPSGRESAPQMC
jgi:hypothetical protein